MHGAAINALAVDAADKQLVTVSDDKTARVWSTTDGSLVSTLRGPIDAGPEGGLYAVALSPSGKTIAVGGYTGITWDNSSEIYLYSRADGNWLGRIALGAGTDTINHLAFSPDGHYLAIATTDSGGLRIVDTRAQTVKTIDPDYTDAIEWLDFAPDGRLVTSSLDGTVRLYSPALARIATYRVPDKHKPFAVAFNKDGSAVAVGLLDAASVLILSGSDLKRTGERAGAAGKSGALSVLAWSADGASLYAGGTYGEPSGRKLVRVWPGADPGKATDIAVSDDTVSALAALDDGVAFASTEPAWAKIAGNGQIQFRHDRDYADFRDGEASFAVSPDGSAVSFGFVEGGKQKAMVDLLLGTFELDPLARPDLKAPATSAAGETLTDWRNGTKPKLDGHFLTLDANETSRSGAGRRAMQGAAWHGLFPARLCGRADALADRRPGAGLGRQSVRRRAARHRRSGRRHLALVPHERRRRDPEPLRRARRQALGRLDARRIFRSRRRRRAAHRLSPQPARPGQAQGRRLRPRRAALRAVLPPRPRGEEVPRGTDEDEIAAQLKRVGDVHAVLGKGLPPNIRLTEYCFGAKCEPVAAERTVPRRRQGPVARGPGTGCDSAFRGLRPWRRHWSGCRA